MSSQDIREIVRKIAIANAIAHKGKAQSGPVLGRLLAERNELKSRIDEIRKIVEDVVQEVNMIPVEEQIEIAKKNWPEILSRSKIEEKKVLPPLPNIEKYSQIVTRFAPNPDCVLHLGSARAIILSHEYARLYNGRFILRFEDTDPRLKRSSLEFFDLIRNDLEWLGCRWDEEYIQSDRMEIYYQYAEKLLRDGNAYVCTCKREDFRRKVMKREACPCRDLTPEENMVRWKRMIDGGYEEGEAVMRIKTDLEHPNPAVRDWPAFRVISPKKYPHPRLGAKYYVWPLFAFANGVDDHLNGVTHIIRGKEHLTNQMRQEYLYRYLGWKYPEAIHYGRLKIVGASLSKFKILRGVQDGTYTGWDDPRLATFMSLRRRGITPEAIKRLIIEIGPRPVDITLSWENLYAINRKIVDPIADRYFFVDDPVRLVINEVHKEFVARIPLHPDKPERGNRVLRVEPDGGKAEIYVSSRDMGLLNVGKIVRLMELFNVRVQSVGSREITGGFVSESYEDARRVGAPLIHWLPPRDTISCHVVMPDASIRKGLAEGNLRGVSVGQIIQFERFGFVRVDKTGEPTIVFFAHR
ncbi:MAG: glutamate--tRNA ligase [Candidatus Bathyarchaeota archaeon]|nr:glutamate--tRNA ligase [Candidatus Bathyarchaeota archaeon]